MHLHTLSLSLIAICFMTLFSSCSDQLILNNPSIEESSLKEYIELNNTLEIVDLVACAGGSKNGLLGSALEPTDVLFYPVVGASDFRYFETENIVDSTTFSQYVEKKLEDIALYNGYMRKFNNFPFVDERMGIVTYKTPGKLHISNPIRLKTNTKPTEVNEDLLIVEENGIMPSFTWTDGIIDENIIYFQAISDNDNNFISGTYTIDKEFTFYDLSNVVFNITDTTSVPRLNPNSEYTITLMGISEDNWINVYMEKSFSTD